MRQAIVTGATGGIGRAISATLAAADYRVGVLDLDPEATQTFAASIDGIALAADVTDPDSVEAALDAFGTAPELVVSNAGVVSFDGLLEGTPDSFRRTVEVNLLGTYHVARACALRMRPGGHIITITSINSLVPSPGTGAYPATKAAVAQLTRQFALECADRGIRANAIAPGFIDAGISAPIYADPKIRKLRGDGVPLRRLGVADDIANAVKFLDSDAGGYINGHELVVDGGVVHSLLTQLPRE